MISVDFKGVVKCDKTEDDEWYAEDKNGTVIDSNFLMVVDRFLDGWDYDPTEEITIKVNRKVD